MANEVIENLTTDYIVWNGRTEEVTVQTGETLAAGDLVARMAATGEIVKYVSEVATDGTGVPCGLIDHAVDASLGAVATYIHTSGTVDENKIDDTVALSDVIAATGTDTITLVNDDTEVDTLVDAYTVIEAGDKVEAKAFYKDLLATISAADTSVNIYQITLRDYLKAIGFVLVNGINYDTY
jgi:hypothetical protein